MHSAVSWRPGQAICEEIEADTRAGWEQAARLENGEVVFPPHIREAYAKLREAGLISYGVREEYGGFGLPAWIANLMLQMVARADAGLMTMIGLQAGVAEDIQEFASEELKQRYLPLFASGEVMGAMDLTEPNAGSDLGGNHHSRQRRRMAASSWTEARFSSPMEAVRSTWCWLAMTKASTNPRERRGGSPSTSSRAHFRMEAAMQWRSRVSRRSSAFMAHRPLPFNSSGPRDI